MLATTNNNAVIEYYIMASVKRNKPVEEDFPPETETSPTPTVPPTAAPPTALTVATLSGYYIDPEIEKLLPWGPVEDYTSKGGKPMKVRRALDIGGLEAFWSKRREHEDRMRVNGVRVWARKDPTTKAELHTADGKRIWDATWYLPVRTPAGEVRPSVPPPRAPTAPTRSTARFAASSAGGELHEAVNQLIVRLESTKARDFPEFIRVKELLPKIARAPEVEEI